MFKASCRTMLKMVRDQRGASAVEYAILVGCIGAILATGAKSYGTSLSNTIANLINVVNFTG